MKTLNELAQNGRGVRRTTQRTNEILHCLVTRIRPLCALRIVLVGILAGMLALAADVTGKWTAELPGRGGGNMTMTMNLKADGNTLTGNISGRRGETEISDGKIDGDNISFSVVHEVNGNQFKQNFKGKVDGDTIHFTVTMEGGMGNGRSHQFDAKRASGA